MSYSIVSCAPGWDPSGTGITTIDATSIGALSAGDAIVVWAPYKNAGGVAVGITVADDLGNIYAEDVGNAYFLTSSNNNGGRFFTCTVTIAGTPTYIRATAGASVTNFGCIPVIVHGVVGSPFQASAAPRRMAGVGTATDLAVSNLMTCSVPPVAVIGFGHDLSGTNGTHMNPGTGFTSLFQGLKSNGLADIVRAEHKRVTSLGNFAATFTMSQNGDDIEIVAYLITENNVDPLIVITDSASPTDGGSLTITGQNFGAVQGGSTVTLNGVAPASVTSWANTQIVIPVDIGANKYLKPVTIEVIVGGISTTYGITISPPAGWACVDIDTPEPNPAHRVTAVGDAASGDQAAYETKGGAVTMFKDVTFAAGPTIGFYAKLNDGTGWGAPGFQALGTPVKALIHSGGQIRQILNSEIGTGLMPVVWLGTQVKVRVTTEGIPLVWDADHHIRKIAATEALQI